MKLTELDSATKRSNPSDDRLHNLVAVVDDQYERINELISENEKLQRDAAFFRNELSKTYGTLSWKITNPLRSVICLVKKLFGTFSLWIDSSFKRTNRSGCTYRSGSNFEEFGLIPRLVSVVIPVVSKNSFLESKIEHFLAQTYYNKELIIVDASSSGEIDSILNKYVSHAQVKIYKQLDKNIDSASRNGFCFAQGEFWILAGTDNCLENHFLFDAVRFFESNPDIDFVSQFSFRHKLRLKERFKQFFLQKFKIPNQTYFFDSFDSCCVKYVDSCHFFACRATFGISSGYVRYCLGIDRFKEMVFGSKVTRIGAIFAERNTYFRVNKRLTEKATKILLDNNLKDLFTDSKKEQNDVLFFDSNVPSLCQRGCDGTVDLVVVSSKTAVDLLNSFMECKCALAIVFDGCCVNIKTLYSLLSKSNVVALVSSVVAYNRLNLIASCPIFSLNSLEALHHLNTFADIYKLSKVACADCSSSGHLPRKINIESKRHILLLVGNFTQGGMENVVIDLARSLENFGFFATIGILCQRGDAEIKARGYGLQVQAFPEKLTKAEFLVWLRNNSICLVNAHYCTFGADVCFANDIPFVQTIHNSYVWLLPEEIQLYKDADRFTSRYIAVSNTVAEYSDIVLGLDVSKIHVVTNGIESSVVSIANFEDERQSIRNEYSLGHGDILFLNVATVIPSKAQRQLIQAFSCIIKNMPTAKLMFLGHVGDNNYRRLLDDLICDLNLSGHVVFAGHQKDVSRYYRGADVFVLPSFWEGWSLALGEAYVNGLPCVVTDVGSAYEFKGDPRVLIVTPPFEDITRLNCSNLMTYINNTNDVFIENLSKALLAASKLPRQPTTKILVDKYNIASTYQKYAFLFDDLIQGKSSPC